MTPARVETYPANHFQSAKAPWQHSSCEEAACGSRAALSHGMLAASAEPLAEPAVGRRQGAVLAMEMVVDPALGGSRQLAVDGACLTVSGAAGPVLGQEPGRQQRVAQDDAAVVMDQHD